MRNSASVQGLSRARFWRRRPVDTRPARGQNAALMRVKVNYHARCFDGLSSASLFTRFYQQCVNPEAKFSYAGLTHRPGNAFPQSAFEGDVNAVVDFRYHRDPRLTWWFDHHVSTFESPADEAHFRADRSGRKFFNPLAHSCTKFLAEMTAERYGFDIGPYAELVHWAEIIDGALFPDAETAVALREPALRLMTVIEGSSDRDLEIRLLADLTSRPLAEIAGDSYVTGPLEPLLAAHRRSIETIRERAREEGGVVSFDIADQGREGFNKFIPYALFPGSRYVVAVSHSAARSKVSVGSNPWSPVPRTHNLAQICERYGGGGHPVVAAISLPPGDLERARQTAREIAKILQA